MLRSRRKIRWGDYEGHFLKNNNFAGSHKSQRSFLRPGLGLVVFLPLSCGCDFYPRMFFLLSKSLSDRAQALERKLKALEDEGASRSTENALLTLPRHLNCPLNVFDRYEAIELFANFGSPRQERSNVTGLLQSQLEYWTGCLPCRSESHITLALHCDASNWAWGGVLLTDGGRIEARDYWRDETGNVNLFEAKAFMWALDFFKSRI